MGHPQRDVGWGYETEGADGVPLLLAALVGSVKGGSQASKRYKKDRMQDMDMKGHDQGAGSEAADYLMKHLKRKKWFLKKAVSSLNPTECEWSRGGVSVYG
jgi:hypothetical protein